MCCILRNCNTFDLTVLRVPQAVAVPPAAAAKTLALTQRFGRLVVWVRAVSSVVAVSETS